MLRALHQPISRAYTGYRYAATAAKAKIPGPQTPLLGALPYMWKHGGPKRLYDVFAKAFQEYGPVVDFSMPGTKMYMLYDPNDFMSIHRVAGPQPFGGASSLWMFIDYFNQPHVQKEHNMPLAFTLGDEWQSLRRPMQKHILSPSHVAPYTSKIIPVVHETSRRLPQAAENGTLVKLLSETTFEMIAVVMLGKRLGVVDQTADPEDKRFVEEALVTMTLSGDLEHSFLRQKHSVWKTKLWKRYCEAMDFIVKRGGHHVREMIKEMKAKEESGVEQTEGDECYLEHLLKEDSVSSKDIVTNMLGFLQGGVDTTANTIQWILLHMAENPEVQDKLAAELKSVFNGADYSPEKLPELPYLRAVSRESHRFTPTVFGTLRRLPMDYTTADGKYTLPAGADLNFMSLGYSIDPRHVENPDEFRPERWLTEPATPKIADHAILGHPFSFGPRMCIGARVAQLEMNILFTRIFQDYKVTLADPSQRRTWKVANHMLNFPDPFPKLKFTKRA